MKKYKRLTFRVDGAQLNEEQRKSALAIIENLLLACGYELPEK